MVKKNKLKKKNIIIAIVGFIVVFILLFLLFRNPLEVSLKIKKLNIGEPFKGQFVATFGNKDVTKDVRFTSNIEPKKKGVYKITFTYKRYKRVMKIEVTDIGKPEITLVDGDTITLPINEKYIEPGFTAIDNYDGDITDKVKVEGEVDHTKAGRYTIKYSVTDEHGNSQLAKRFIEVSDKSPETMDIREFSLSGYFKNSILKETKNGGEKYSDQFTYIGDSTALYYVMNKVISGKQLWHREGVDLNSIFTKTFFINHTDSNKTLLDAYKTNKPSHVLLMLGTNSVATMETNYFITQYKKLLQEMILSNPGGIIIVQSIFPVAKEYDDNNKALNNNKINKMNYNLAKLCEELGLPFLNTAEALKDSQGQLREGFYRTSSNEKGVHLSNEGNEVAMKYFREHMKE